MIILHLILALLLVSGAAQASDKHAEKEEHAEKERHEEGGKHAESEKEGEHNEEGSNPNIGPGKAVEAVDHDKGMRLSTKAAGALGVRTALLRGPEPYRVPSGSLIFSQDEVAVYRLRGGWLKRIKVQLLEKSKADAVIRSREFKSGDHVVVAGAALVRVAELDLSRGDVGHGH